MTPYKIHICLKLKTQDSVSCLSCFVNSEMEEPHSRPRGPEYEGSNNCKYDQKGKTNSQLRMKVKLILNKGHTIGKVLILDISAKKYFGWDSFVTIGPCQNSNDVRTRQNRDEQGREGGKKESRPCWLIFLSPLWHSHSRLILSFSSHHPVPRIWSALLIIHEN